VSLKRLENVPNKSAAALNAKFEVSIAAILSLFPSPYLAHALPFYGAANVFFLEVNAWNVCLFHALMVVQLSKAVLCHAHFAVANLRGILRMLFFPDTDSAFNWRYRYGPIRRQKTKCWQCALLPAWI